VNLEKYLNETIEIKIDRPLGSKHPKWNFTYPINYGYLPNTLNDDGEEIDAYVLSVEEPISEFKGKCIAIIHRINDNDDKLVIVPENKEEIKDEEIIKSTFFQEKYFKIKIIRKIKN
jgi:inorganic pyrophosphatase